MTTTANNRIETIEDVLARIKKLTPLIRKNAAEGDSARRVSEETIDALKEAGAFRILVPRRVGGLESSSRAGRRSDRGIPVLLRAENEPLSATA